MRYLLSYLSLKSKPLQGFHWFSLSSSLESICYKRWVDELSWPLIYSYALCWLCFGKACYSTDSLPLLEFFPLTSLITSLTWITSSFGCFSFIIFSISVPPFSSYKEIFFTTLFIRFYSSIALIFSLSFDVFPWDFAKPFLVLAIVDSLLNLELVDFRGV